MHVNQENKNSWAKIKSIEINENRTIYVLNIVCMALLVRDSVLFCLHIVVSTDFIENKLLMWRLENFERVSTIDEKVNIHRSRKSIIWRSVRLHNTSGTTTTRKYVLCKVEWSSGARAKWFWQPYAALYTNQNNMHSREYRMDLRVGSRNDAITEGKIDTHIFVRVWSSQQALCCSWQVHIVLTLLWLTQ